MWTSEKAKELAALNARRDELVREEDEARIAVAESIESCIDATLSGVEVDRLVANAFVICAALAPFNVAPLPTVPPIVRQLDDFGNEPKSGDMLVFAEGGKRKWVSPPPTPPILSTSPMVGGMGYYCPPSVDRT